jgi:hypothetical protein
MSMCGVDGIFGLSGGNWMYTTVVFLRANERRLNEQAHTISSSEIQPAEQNRDERNPLEMLS